MITDLRELMEKIKQKISDDSDMVWVFSDSAKDLRDEIDQCLVQIRNGDFTGLETLNMLFLPTSAFQEHSISNGWANEYIRLADRFDRVYLKLKNNNI